MTDLHCHILPAVDDGAKDVQQSMELLKLQAENGVENIIFTSHFNPEKTDVDTFIARRNRAFDAMVRHCGDMGMKFKLGAEIMFSPLLMELDAEKLRLGDTDYMLIEFPITHKPHFITDTFYHLRRKNIVPVIAHVERYNYAMENPEMIYDWVNSGALVQINAESLIKDKKTASMLYKLISWNLVHLISTDTHSVTKRPPLMKKAFAELRSKLGDDVAEYIRQNGDDVFNNLQVDTYNIHKPKKFLGMWV